MGNQSGKTTRCVAKFTDPINDPNCVYHVAVLGSKNSGKTEFIREARQIAHHVPEPLQRVYSYLLRDNSGFQRDFKIQFHEYLVSPKENKAEISGFAASNAKFQLAVLLVDLSDESSYASLSKSYYDISEQVKSKNIRDLMIVATKMDLVPAERISDASRRFVSLASAFTSSSSSIIHPIPIESDERLEYIRSSISQLLKILIESPLQMEIIDPKECDLSFSHEKNEIFSLDLTIERPFVEYQIVLNLVNNSNDKAVVWLANYQEPLDGTVVFCGVSPSTGTLQPKSEVQLTISFVTLSKNATQWESLIRFNYTTDFTPYKYLRTKDNHSPVLRSHQNLVSYINAPEGIPTEQSDGLTYMSIISLKNSLSLPIRGKIRKEATKSNSHWKVLPSDLQPLVKDPDNPESNNPFTTHNFIGSGAFGKVYQCLLRGKKVAVKLWMPSSNARIVASPKAPDDFITELKTLQKFSGHPNIVQLIGACQTDGQYFLVMELCSSTLSPIFSNPAVHIQHKLKLALQIAHGLSYIHSKSRIHRDLKSHNILLSVSDYKAVIADFGTTKAHSDANTICVGTPYYMAPEIRTSRKYSHPADVFSFGTILYEILTGTVPTRSEEDIIHGKIPEIPEILAEAYPPWVALIKRCCNPEPNSRPLMVEVIHELQLIIDACEKVPDFWKSKILTQHELARKSLVYDDEPSRRFNSNQDRMFEIDKNMLHFQPNSPNEESKINVKISNKSGQPIEMSIRLVGGRIDDTTAPKIANPVSVKRPLSGLFFFNKDNNKDNNTNSNNNNAASPPSKSPPPSSPTSASSQTDSNQQSIESGFFTTDNIFLGWTNASKNTKNPESDFTLTKVLESGASITVVISVVMLYPSPEWRGFIQFQGMTTNFPAMRYTHLVPTTITLNPNWISDSPSAASGVIPQNQYWNLNLEDLGIDAAIGSGSYGTVYKAILRGALVAVKRWDMGTRDKPPPDFINELRSLSENRHTNVVKLIGASAEIGKCFIVLEYHKIGDLHCWLESLTSEVSFLPSQISARSKLEVVVHEKASIQDLPSAKLKIALDIARGLAFLHSREKVHRDVKSFNILLKDDLSAVLADFGSSKRIIMDNTIANHTMNIGTKWWMAPEVYNKSKSYGLEIDVFSFGIVLFELFTNEMPHQRDDEDIRLGVIPPLPQYGYNPIIVKLIQKCCSPKPEKRPTMNEVVQILSTLQSVSSMKLPVKMVPQASPSTSSDSITGSASSNSLPSLSSSQMLYLSKAGPQTDLSKLKLAGLDFTGYDFAGFDLSMVSLEGANLTRASLKGATLSILDDGFEKPTSAVEGAPSLPRFFACNLSRANLTDTVLPTDLSGVNLSHTKLEDRDFSSSILITANMSRCMVKGCVFPIDMSGVNLSHVDLSYFDLTPQIFAKTDLSHCVLTGTVLPKDLKFADLSYTDLSNRDFTKSFLDHCNLRGAILNKSYFPRSLMGVNFSEASLIDVDLSLSLLRGSVFAGARLMATRMPSNLEGVDFRNATLVQTDLSLYEQDLIVVEGKVQQKDTKTIEVQGMPSSLTRSNSFACQLLRLSSKSSIPSRLVQSVFSSVPSLIYFSHRYDKTFTNQDLALLPRTLTHLDLSSNEIISSDGLANLPPSLQYLILRSAYLIDDKAVWPPKLVYLDIGLNQTVSDAFVPALPPTLTYLDVGMSRHFTNSCIERLPPALTHLDIGSAPYLSDEAFSTWVEPLYLSPAGPGYKGLLYLNLGCNKALNDNGIRSLPKSLIHLDLNSNPNISDAGLSHLPPALTYLDLSSAHLITNFGLIYLPSTLAYLELHCNKNISDSGIKDLPPQLVHLSLHTNKQLTNACVPFLPRTLKYLDLHSSKLTPDCCPNLPPGLVTFLAPMTVSKAFKRYKSMNQTQYILHK